VYQLLIGQSTDGRFLVDTLKFLGTVQVLDTIYDAPASDGFWVNGQHSNPDIALAFSDLAFRTATAADYGDGCAWALCVSAFAEEARHDTEAARECYQQAMQVVGDGVCRSTTGFHILLYQAAFLRRDKRYPEATETLTQASSAFLKPVRGPDRLRLAEQHLLLASALGDHGEARRQFRVIWETHTGMPMLLDGSTRFERRMRRLQTDPRFAPSSRGAVT
jgi:hypothetical protein